MAQIYTFKLTRIDQSSPWGFRLQGGKDFGTPLLIQKVNAGSIAEKVGLRVGDAIIRVNNTDVSEQRHKDAQETIINAGNYFELGVQRGGFNTWRPTVTPVGTVPIPNPNDSISPITVTRTSLSATNQAGQTARIPSGFNARMKAFSPCNGTDNENASVARALASKQYNSPVSMYSDESIAETLSAQAEVLTGGVLGVNFKKNEKSFDTESSEVFKMVVEAENEPKTPQESVAGTPTTELRAAATPPVDLNASDKFTPVDLDSGGVSDLDTDSEIKDVTSRSISYSKFTSSLTAKSTVVSNRTAFETESTSSSSPFAHNLPSTMSIVPEATCTECRKNIAGVFVRIRDKNLHVECFKCATCGTSLKNVGYYNINDKLYCDIHAEMIAKQNGANYGGNTTGTTQREASNTNPSSLSCPFTRTIPSPLSSPFKPQQTNTSNVSFQNNVSTNLNGMKSPSLNRQYQPSPQQQQQRPGILKTKTEAANALFGVNRVRLPFLRPITESTAPPIYRPINTKVGLPPATPVAYADELNALTNARNDRASTNNKSDEELEEEIGRLNTNAASAAAASASTASDCTPHGVRALSPHQPPPSPNQIVTFPPTLPPQLPLHRERNSDCSPVRPLSKSPLPSLILQTITSPTSAIVDDRRSPKMGLSTSNVAVDAAHPQICATPVTTTGVKVDKTMVGEGFTTPPLVFEATVTTNQNIFPASSLGDSQSSTSYQSQLKWTDDRRSSSPHKQQTYRSSIETSTSRNTTCTRPNFDKLSGTTPLLDNQSQQKGANRFSGGGNRSFIDAPNSAPKTSAGLSTPRRGKGVWNPQNLSPEARIPLCAGCSSQIRGPFVTALGKIWCPEHFVCTRVNCGRSLLEIGFVEEPSGFYCEYCFEQYLAPTCAQCSNKIKGDCLNAIGKHFHPDCFTCAFCGKYFGNSPFFLEDGLPYCERDWNELFTTKCIACGFPIEAGDRWVEALGNNYHSPCFNCTMCKMNLEGQSFYAKGGRPFCKNHSR